jgi:Pregnancy-associated plasma protein-A
MISRLIIFYLFFFSIQINAQTRQSLECVDREFMVKVHVVLDSTFKRPCTDVQIFATIAKINTIWKPICMKFNVCEIRIDSNYNFSDWDQDTMETEYLALNREPRMINFVVVNSILVPAGAAGYAVGTIDSRGKPYICVAGAGSTLWIHELGHYFGLDHTFKVAIGLVDGSDCATKDDLVCDTPPDPDPSGSAESNCVYNGAFKDVSGKYYNPLVENFMSYYKSCRNSFTHQQYEKMVTQYKLDKEAHF